MHNMQIVLPYWTVRFFFIILFLCRLSASDSYSSGQNRQAAREKAYAP
jgi:hypothetical protein